MRACTCCTGNAGELQPLSTLIQTHGNLNCCVSVLALMTSSKKSDVDWVRCFLVKIRSLFPTLSLPEEIDLLSLSGSYESAASRGVLLPFTGAAR